MKPSTHDGIMNLVVRAPGAVDAHGKMRIERRRSMGSKQISRRPYALGTVRNTNSQERRVPVITELPLWSMNFLAIRFMGFASGTANTRVTSASIAADSVWY